MLPRQAVCLHLRDAVTAAATRPTLHGLDAYQLRCLSFGISENSLIDENKPERNKNQKEESGFHSVLTRQLQFFSQMKSSEEIQDKNDDRVSNLLDGKRGWIVTAACFMAAFLTDGITFCFGLILFELVQVFDEPVEKVAWIPSFLLGIQLLSGKNSSYFDILFIN